MKKAFWYIAIIIFTVGIYLIDYFDIHDYKPEDNSSLISLTDQQFYQKLQSDPGTLCVLYYTLESPYSLKMENTLSEIKDNKYNNLPMYKVNVEEYPNLSYDQNVAGTPMVVLYKEGEEKKRIMGNVSVTNIDMILKRITK